MYSCVIHCKCMSYIHRHYTVFHRPVKKLKELLRSASHMPSIRSAYTLLERLISSSCYSLLDLGTLTTDVTQNP